MKEFLKLVTIAAVALLIVAAVANAFLVERFRVEDNGMAPALISGDEVLAWKKFGVDTGDILVCPHPGQAGSNVFGRVIAYPGQTLSTDHNGTLYIGGERTNVEPRGDVQFFDVTRNKQFTMSIGDMQFSPRLTRTFFIEKGQIFNLRDYRVDKGLYLLGDNRSDTQHDSRSFGEIDGETCYGQIFMRWKPAPSVGDDISHGYLDWIK